MNKKIKQDFFFFLKKKVRNYLFEGGEEDKVNNI